MDKSLIVFLIAIVALFFFMSMRSNAEGVKPKIRYSKDGNCGKEFSKRGRPILVRCPTGLWCTVKPESVTDLSGKCVNDENEGWMMKKKKEDKK